jgi:hypothetical protein
MRQVVKINTAVFLRDLSKWNMILGILLLLTQFVLGIAFIAKLNLTCPGTGLECDDGLILSYN